MSIKTFFTNLFKKEKPKITISLMFDGKFYHIEMNGLAAWGTVTSDLEEARRYFDMAVKTACDGPPKREIIKEERV